MTSTTITPELQDFLAAVRVEREDLDADEQREILRAERVRRPVETADQTVHALDALVRATKGRSA